MNKGKSSSKSRSWNKKIKRKNMMCAQCESKNMTKIKQDHDNILKIGVEQTKSNVRFYFYLHPLAI
jgi:hypothetical protein